MGFASLYKNELIDFALLKEEGMRPKSLYLPSQTPRGTYKMEADVADDDIKDQDHEDQIFEDE